MTDGSGTDRLGSEAPPSKAHISTKETKDNHEEDMQKEMLCKASLTRPRIGVLDIPASSDRACG